MKLANTVLLVTVLMFTGVGLVHAATGQDLYQQQCSACHGATGAGDGPQAGQNGLAAPKPLTQSVTERMVVEKAMMQGVNNVPGHGNAPLFVGDELQKLIDYVYKLAKP